MPFTPSHAVLALPFIRTPLAPAAIAIGAMTPDLPLFTAGLGLPYSFTHEPTNLLWTLVIAFVLFLLWRVIVRPATFELVPDVVRTRLPREWRSRPTVAARSAVGFGENSSYPIMLVLSLAIGVMSHIVWDAFTHRGRWGTELIPIIGQEWGPLPGYKWTQYGSGILGLAIILLWAAMWLKRQSTSTTPRRLLPQWVLLAWIIVLVAVMFVFLIVNYIEYGPLSPQFTVQHWAYASLPIASGVWGVATILLCIVIAIIKTRADAANIPKTEQNLA